MGIPAVAIGGMTALEELLKALRRRKRLFVALNNTADANTQSREMAIHLGGETYLLQFPHGVKDANDWRAMYGAKTTDASNLLNQAQSWLDVEVDYATKLEEIARQDAIRQLFTYAQTLDAYGLTMFKTAIEDLGIRGRTFADLLKATETSGIQHDEASNNDMPEVLSDSMAIPRFYEHTSCL